MKSFVKRDYKIGGNYDSELSTHEFQENNALDTLAAELVRQPKTAKHFVACSKSRIISLCCTLMAALAATSLGMQV